MSLHSSLRESIYLVDHKGKWTPRSGHAINHILLKSFLGLKVFVLKNGAVFLEIESCHWWDYLICKNFNFFFLPIVATLSLQNELVISYVILGLAMAEEKSLVSPKTLCPFWVSLLDMAYLVPEWLKSAVPFYSSRPHCEEDISFINVLGVFNQLFVPTWVGVCPF